MSYVVEPGADPQEVRRRRRLAEALLQQGGDTSPILSPWQGAARLAQGLMGGIELGREDKRENDLLAAQKAQDAEFNATIAKMYGGGGGGAVSSALGGGKPMEPIKLGGFDPSVGRVLQFEGGLNPADTNGTPSNMGINQAANPDVDVKNLNRDQAINIYRDRYWNTIGADKLDPRLAHVAFDTSVIAGPGKAKELLEKSGGDPETFLKLREDFQNRLLQANPEKFGKYAKAWANRNATLRADIGVNPGGMFAVGGGGQSTMAGGSDNLQPQPTQVASADMATAMQLLQRARTPQQMAIAKQMVEEAQKANDPLRALQIQKAQRDLSRPDLSGVEVMRDPTTGEIVRVDKATGQATVVRPGQASPKAPETRVVKQPDGSEVALQWDPESKAWKPMNAPEGGNPVRAPVKLTEQQSKDIGFATRAEKILPRLEAQDKALTDAMSSAGGKLPVIGNYLKRDEYRKAEQTGRELLAVILRKDTGAAVTDGEMQLYGSMYLPQPGDDEATIQQKREGRKAAIDGLRRGLGGLDIILEQRDKLDAIAANRGKPAPASTPAASEPTTTKVRRYNPKTGKFEETTQ